MWNFVDTQTEPDGLDDLTENLALLSLGAAATLTTICLTHYYCFRRNQTTPTGRHEQVTPELEKEPLTAQLLSAQQFANKGQMEMPHSHNDEQLAASSSSTDQEPRQKYGKKSGGNVFTAAYKTVKRKVKPSKAKPSVVNIESLNCILSNIIHLFDQNCGAYQIEGIYRVSGNHIKGLSEILSRSDLTPDRMLHLLGKCFGSPVFDSKGQIHSQTVHNLIYVLKNKLNGDDIQFINGCRGNKTIETLPLGSLVNSTDPAKTIQAHIGALIERGHSDEAAFLHNLFYLFRNISLNQTTNKMTEVNLANILAPSFFAKFFGLSHETETDPIKAFEKQTNLINEIKGPFAQILNSDLFCKKFEEVVQPKPKVH